MTFERARELAALRKEELVERMLELEEENTRLQCELKQVQKNVSRMRHVDVKDPALWECSSHEPGSVVPVTSSSTANATPPPAAVSPATTATKPGAYTISLSVMVIENGSTITVPLSSVIDKSYMHPDMREADTPLVRSSSVGGDSESFSRNSIGNLYVERSPSMCTEESLRRGSELRSFCFASATATAAAAAVAAAPSSASGACRSGRPSISFDFAGVDDANEPVPQDPGLSQQEQLARRRSVRHELRQLSLGRLLGKHAPSLDPDALVSSHTLHTFHQRLLDGCGALSPVSSYASAIYHYIVKCFALRNGCRHDPSDVEGFGRTLCTLCGEVKHILQGEPWHGSTVSPCYVFGDLHGNFLDLFYFLDNLVSFQDLRYTPHRFVFLGDYVDRGDFSVEVIAYLFAMKVMAPEKVLLLRGNHEDTLVSGDITGYGDSSFRSQCRILFGHALGEEFWHRASETFAYLPLSANIDGKIFCTHGGIPRYRGGVDDRLQILSSEEFPAMESFFNAPENESPQQRMYRQMAMDTCWADPADDESVLDRWGFGANPRGKGVIIFGSTAVDDFLSNYNFEYIFRAHQEKSNGLKLSKSARVFTIFSTSAYVGHENGAGVVLVAEGKIRLIIKNADSATNTEAAPNDDDADVGGEDG